MKIYLLDEAPWPWRITAKALFLFYFSILLSSSLLAQDQRTVTGTVTSSVDKKPLEGVTVLGDQSKAPVFTDSTGKFTIRISAADKFLQFTFVGMKNQQVEIGGRSTFTVELEGSATNLEDVVVIGFGARKKETLTGAISNITAKDIGRVQGATVSSVLAGKLPGVAFRMADGRPGATANIQIRNMGGALFVIDGVEKDFGQFNNISPNDIESITVLKDASAAIYGVRAANGVVLVTTKRGKLGEKNTININAYTGWQSWNRFPKGLTNSYDYMKAKAEAEINQFGRTDITQSELDKYRAGTEYGYKSFDWYDFIIKPNAPQSFLNASTSGGSDRINYYVSLGRLDQSSVLGREFTFGRTNLQSNVDAKVSNSLKVGVQINGRIESREQPGVPGTDDYFAPRFAIMRNLPTERPYANDNPAYPNDIGHNNEQWAVQNKATSGYWEEDWRVLQTNLNAEWQTPLKGLTAKGVYSYYFADRVMNGHEYTFDVYTYNPVDSTYRRTGGSQNPFRERSVNKVLETVMQGQLDYTKSFGQHTINATVVYQKTDRQELGSYLQAPPQTNVLPIIRFPDMKEYSDTWVEQARVSYVGRLNYTFADKYIVDITGRRDAAWKFAPDKRVGFFPGISAAWRIINEPFFKNINGKTLTDLKLRASYGEMGDDDINAFYGDFNAFGYVPGYNYGTSTAIIGGNAIIGARDRSSYGIPYSNISWFVARMANFGVDFALLDGRLSGTVEYFNRKRTGLPANKTDVPVPSELGYPLVPENLNSDRHAGGELSLLYNTAVKDVNLRFGGNVSYARRKLEYVYNPIYNNGLQQYRDASEYRYTGIFWGYEQIGQFQSMQEIKEYPVNVDGQGNRTLLPGDLIYKDQNGDGVINERDVRPIGFPGGTTPLVNFGLTIGASWRGFDFAADFSGAGGYSYNLNHEVRVPFKNTGNLLKEFHDNSWRRADPLDPNSAWIPGKYPALRYNMGDHSNYNVNSTFWLVNVNYLRLRTMELGYSLPQSVLERVKVQGARFYVNTYNLFSIDNLRKHGLDPEVVDDNGIQYPQSRLINVGVNLTL